MTLFSQRVVYASAFYVLTMSLLLIVRPSPLFDRTTGSITRFGVSTPNATAKTTPLSLGVVSVLVAVLSMFMFTLIDLIFS
jgi:hypothetical protein